jgi:hypothetical protein
MDGNGFNQDPLGLSAAISSPLNIFAGQGYRRGKVIHPDSARSRPSFPTNFGRYIEPCPRKRTLFFSLQRSVTYLCNDTLVPRRDMEADGFHRNIHANIMFATWLDRIPGRDLRARGIIQFIFPMS